ncbi:FkbM family methyltransferase [Hymenobacter sp. B81]|uniref:FkbM family methyltransferase n=1 Tax=Hymenobacter sp. B81 TaxID=3344878 RepID=UPI0037DC1BF0
MLRRALTALDKLRFCLTAAADLRSGLRLLSNSKKFSALDAHRRPQPTADAAESYALRLGRQPQQLRLRTYAGDLSIFYEVFWRGSYDVPALRGASVHTIVDAGANVGLAALDLLLRFPAARVICLEPEGANAELLRHNLAPYVASGRAVVERAALANADTQVSIQSPGYAYNATVREQAGADMVPAYSMASVMQRHGLAHIDLLKIDVEDYEQVVFAQHTGWLAQVQHLIIEIHSPTSHAVTMQALGQHGFVVEQLSGRSATEGIFWGRRA